MTQPTEHGAYQNQPYCRSLLCLTQSIHVDSQGGPYPCLVIILVLFSRFLSYLVHEFHASHILICLPCFLCAVSDGISPRLPAFVHLYCSLRCVSTLFATLCMCMLVSASFVLRLFLPWLLVMSSSSGLLPSSSSSSS